MKTLRQPLLAILLAAATLGACTSSSNDGPAPVEVITVTDLQGNTANSPGFTFYDLDQGVIVADTASNAWDIGFSGTTIIANSGNNGGIVMLNIAFETLDEAPTTGYVNENGGWYTYTGPAPTGPQHAVLPNANTTLVIKTPDGRYAKIRMISYYQGNPDTSTDEFANLQTRPAGRYFTFEFAIQTDGSALFE